MKNKIIASLIAGACIAGSSAALADPVKWTLTGVTFNDGGTASGSFVYDAETNGYSDVSITTTTGTIRTGATYPGPVYGFANSSFVGPLTGSPNIGERIFQIYTEPRTDAGGVLEVFDYSSEDNCASADCSSPGSPSRTVVTGTLVGGPVSAPEAIPTLSEWAMILLGLTLAGSAALYIQRRRLEA